MIRHGRIKNCDITIRDIDVANQIWGKHLAALKGKTARKQPGAYTPEQVMIPKEYEYLKSSVHLSFDILHVNKVPFLITWSHKACYLTLLHLHNRNLRTVYRAFARVLKFYYNHGWRVTNCNGDPKFGALQQKLHEIKGGPKCILAAKGEHSGPIERQILSGQGAFLWVAEHSPIQAHPLIIDGPFSDQHCQNVESLPQEGRNNSGFQSACTGCGRAA